MKKTLFAVVAIVGFIAVASVMYRGRMPDPAVPASNVAAPLPMVSTEEVAADQAAYGAWRQNNVVAGKADGCDAVSDPFARGTCVADAALKDAVLNRDPAPCDRIDSGIADPDACRLSVAVEKALAAKSPADCAAMGQRRQECEFRYYFNRARDRKDVSFCATATDQAVAGRCTDAYLIETGFVPANGAKFSCGVLSTDSVRADCVVMQKALADNRSREVIANEICPTLATNAFVALCAPVLPVGAAM